MKMTLKQRLKLSVLLYNLSVWRFLHKTSVLVWGNKRNALKSKIKSIYDMSWYNATTYHNQLVHVYVSEWEYNNMEELFRAECYKRAKNEAWKQILQTIKNVKGE